VKIDEALPTFFAEATELLREMETDLLACTSAAPSADDVNRIFRAAHTLKGSAGLFGFDAIVEFVHEIEALLDRVRLGKVVLDSPLASALLECKDHIDELLSLASNGNAQPAAELLATGTALLGALGAAPRETVSASAPVQPSASATWHVSLRFSPDVLVGGMDPLGFLRYLNTFGSIRGMVVLTDGLPQAADLDPHKCYLGFEFRFDTEAPREKIEGAFEFVREDSTLRLVPPGSAPGKHFETLRAAGLADSLSAQILAECGSLTASEIEVALRPTAAVPTATAVSAATAVPAAASAIASQPAAPAQGSSPNRDGQTIRVDSLKLDGLIMRIGELITAAAGAKLAARRSGNRDFEESMANVTSLVEEIREGSLQLRMVKIGATFSRFRRVVHDVSRELGKEIELQISGEDTELDKTVVERIADPLTHLVRNAIDHGIEAADVRTARGKSPAGSIKLNAFHDSGTIVIEVSDDGGGLKRERIVAKALERGLLEASAKPSDSDLFNLIFEPGFSTAEAVTNLSGRGVGMDVVKRNITALRGVVSVKSVEGAGTTVTVRLPLTLAIINGFQVGVGSSSFVLPLDSIDECVEFSSSDGHDFTSLRGEVLPFIHLRALFGSPSAPAKRQSIVVVSHGGKRAGIVVDTLLGEFQTVIKPLAKMFTQVDCVSGSSILGTGEVALILDVPAVLERAIQRSQASTRHRSASAVAAVA
jgi:two-component system, chemotaxis family, sensor kinase CheA